MKLKKFRIMLVLILLGIIQPVMINAEEVNPEQGVTKQGENKEEVIDMPDTRLKGNINMKLGKPYNSDITKKDMESLVDLDISYKGISDLTGLEYAINLTYLDIAGNRISDISTLRNLTSLTSLSVESNSILDWSPIENLTNLTELGISDTNITDLSPLENLTNLTELGIIDTSITNLSPLENLTNLTKLDISNTGVTDLSPLENLTNLTELGISDTSITDISPLENLTNLTKLDIGNTGVTDLSPLENLTNLTVLIAYGNELDNKDLEELSKYISKPMCINLDSNHISDLRPLKNKYYCDDGPSGARTVYGQKVKLDDIEVSENKEISYTVYNISGDEEKVILSTNLEVGENNLFGNWIMPEENGKGMFSGTIEQNVFYSVMAAEPQKEIKEENPLTDAELIDLFEVESPETTPIMVDQSGVNYSVPGEYTVVFTQNDSAGNLIGKQTVTLVIEDVLPIITSEEAELTINLGDEKPDYIKAYKANATEITENDLSDKLYVDDSWVDYNKTGEYTVVLRVRDEETNTTSMAVKLNIVRDVTKPADPLTPELGKDKPDNPDTLTPEVDVERPKNPDTLTPEIDQEKPEVVDPINPEEPEVVDPINPEEPEVVDPINPEKPEVADPINPEEPEVVDPKNPEVTIPKEEEDGLKDTGKQLPVIGLTLSVLSLFVIYVTKKNIA